MSADNTNADKKYLAMLSALDACARNHHRGLDPERREEAVAETRAWALAWCRSADEKGRLDRVTPGSLAAYAARMFRSGRRFAGSSSTDALSPQTRAMGRATAVSMSRAPESASLTAALTDSRSPNPYHVARVDLDYPLALRDPALPERAPECFNRLVGDTDRGHVTRIAEAMGVSGARICQLKHALAGALERIGYAPGGAVA